MVSAVGVIQARSESSRLPGKVLLPIASFSVLGLIVHRLKKLDLQWWLATTDLPSDDLLAQTGHELGLSVLRGSENDVLSRYERISELVKSEYFVKVNGDNPTVTAEGVQMMLDEAESSLTGLMLADFGPDRKYPQGHLPQIVRRDAFLGLRDMISVSNQDFHVVHATTALLKDFTQQTRIDLGPAAPQLRWTLDYPADYAALLALFENLEASPLEAGYRDFLRSVMKEPAKTTANRGMRQKELHEG